MRLHHSIEDASEAHGAHSIIGIVHRQIDILLAELDGTWKVPTWTVHVGEIVRAAPNHRTARVLQGSVRVSTCLSMSM